MIFIPILLWGTLLAGLGAVIADLIARRSAAFSALVLVSWLLLFSFFLAFSIGWLVSTANILLALLCLVAFKEYRGELAFVVAASVLLTLFLSGQWSPARLLLEILLVLALVYCLSRFRGIRKRQTHEQARVGLQIGGLLLLLSMLLIDSPFGVFSALLTFGTILFLLLRVSAYRGHLVLLSAVSFVWVFLLTRQMSMGI